MNHSNLIIKGIINKDSINTSERTFSGFGSVQVRDRQGDFIPINEFRPVLEKLLSMGHKIPLQDTHTNHGVGEVINWKFINTKDGIPGLYLTAKIYSRYPSDDDIWNCIKNGEYKGFSLGGKAGEKIPICDEQGCYNLLKNLELWEFSLVEQPANQLALIDLDSVNKLAKSYKTYKVYIKKSNPILKYIKRCGDKFCVYSEDGKRIGTHPTEEDANQQLRAIDKGWLSDFGEYVEEDWVNRHFVPGQKPESDWSDKIKELWHKKQEEYDKGKFIHKAKVYVKNPQDAPQGVKINEGERGGHYYESEGLEHREPNDIQPKNFDEITEVLNNKINEKYKNYNVKVKLLNHVPGQTGSDVLTIHSIYVPIEYRNKGIGANVIRELIQDAKKNGYYQIQGEAFPKSEGEVVGIPGKKIKNLFRWYEKLGFTLNTPEILDEINDDEYYVYSDFVQPFKNSPLWIFIDLEDEREKDKEENDKKIREIKDDGHKVLSSEVLKAKVYIKNPSDAPGGYKVERGERGGHYYESEQRGESQPQESKPEIQPTELKLKELVQNGIIFQTGLEIAIPYLHNKEKSPNAGIRFGQDIEPYGKYVILEEPGSIVLPGWEQSTVLLHHPLVIEWKDWKQKLSEHYGGAKGKKLTRSLLAVGYDSIVTIDGNHTSEIVLLHPRRTYNELVNSEYDKGKFIHKAKVYVKNPSDAPKGVKINEGERGGHYYESSGYKDNLVYDDDKTNDNVVILDEDSFDAQIKATLSNFVKDGKVIKVNPPSEDEIQKQIEIAGLPKEINVIVIPYYCEAANAFNIIGEDDIYLLSGTSQTDKKLLESDIKILSDVGYDTKAFTWENRRAGTIIHENGHIRTWRRAGIKSNDAHWETKMHLKYSEYEEYILKYFKDKDNYINSYILNKSIDAGVLSELIAEDFRLAWGGKAGIIPHSYFYDEDFQDSQFRENRHQILRKVGLI